MSKRLLITDEGPADAVDVKHIGSEPSCWTWLSVNGHGHAVLVVTKMASEDDGGPSPYGQQVIDALKKHDELQAEISQLKAENERLTKSNAINAQACGDYTEELAALRAQRDALQAEVERLKVSLTDSDDRIVELRADIARRESWQESVLAEVGEFEGNKILTIDQDDIDCTYHSSPYVEHLERRAEHLAAKLVEAKSCEVVIRSALQVAFNHLDMQQLQISHCKDHAAIMSAMKLGSEFQPLDTDGRPVPPTGEKPLPTMEDALAAGDAIIAAEQREWPVNPVCFECGHLFSEHKNAGVGCPVQTGGGRS